jgi:iron uptake system component EfeO
MSPARRSTAALAFVSALSLGALAACGSSGSPSATDTPAGGATTPGATTTDAAATGGVTKVAVTMTGNACQLDTASAPAGPITFTITNKDATAITEVELLSGEKIVGEKENLAPGLPAVSLTLTLGGGDYAVYCPGASPEKVAFKVTGKAAPSPTGSVAQLLQTGATQYGSYVTTQVDSMVTAVQNLQKAVDSGKVAAAEKAYAEARPFYEKIESDVEGFVLPGFKPTDNKGNLDYLIDMRASNLDPAVGWSGFHAIERDVFQGGKITAQTKTYAKNLTKNVTELAKVAKTLSYKPEDLANGAAGLLEEVQRNKITGEEELYSHIDLVDFAGNVEGAEQAFEALKPGLTKIDATMTETIAKRFAAVDAMLDGYRDDNALGGYERWTPALKAKDANKVSQTVQALQDALSSLAEKVATA